MQVLQTTPKRISSDANLYMIQAQRRPRNVFKLELPEFQHETISCRHSKGPAPGALFATTGTTLVALYLTRVSPPASFGTAAVSQCLSPDGSRRSAFIRPWSPLESQLFPKNPPTKPNHLRQGSLKMTKSSRIQGNPRCGLRVFLALLSAIFLALAWHVSDPLALAQDPASPPPSTNRDRRPNPEKTDPPKSEKQLAEERKARDAARKRGEITFDDLKFDIEKDGQFKKEMITKEIEELNKKTVKLRGFILPTSVFQQSGIKQFVLVRDNQECCFGPGAALYDCVIVEMEASKTATFSTRVVSVKGKLEIDPESFRYPEGGHYAIYKMTAEEVK